MARLLPNSKSMIAWLLVTPTIAWFYVGLFATMAVWYSDGLPAAAWQDHLLHFTVIYLLWLTVFFSYRLFDWETLRIDQAMFGRLVSVLVICLIIAALYFYFQPALLITPRRFLLVHMLITGAGIALWYALMRRAAPRSRRRPVYIHNGIESPQDVQSLILNHQFLGLQYEGLFDSQPPSSFAAGTIVVMPARTQLNLEDSRTLFGLRNQGVRFIEYHELHESLTRTVHLSVLSDLWFIDSIDYGSHWLFDIGKRAIDLLFGLFGAIIFIVTFPPIGLLVKLTSPGPVLFAQKRVGQLGEVFTLYKYRSMAAGSATDTWTEKTDSRITPIGRFLRATRLDELPQSLNILKGDMSIVGPRPEQVHIVEQLRQQIPYYDERHIVKPGLTGWAQLHVYAATVEETKRKLQYDLYYIKHRSLLFDAEIILKTVYNIISFSGR